MTERSFQVTVSMNYDADDPQDAVRQMIGTLAGQADKMGYRVDEYAIDGDGSLLGTSFIDGEDVVSV